MCGSDYCGTCTPTQEITDYAEGRSHETPTFGDGAQQRVAMYSRSSILCGLIRAEHRRALEFPEFHQRDEVRGYADRFAGKNNVETFDKLVGRIPAFAAFIKAAPWRGRLAGRPCRKVRRKAYTNWRRERLITYIRQHGEPALREIHAVLDQPLPWWMQPTELSLADKLKVNLNPDPTLAEVLEDA